MSAAINDGRGPLPLAADAPPFGRVLRDLRQRVGLSQTKLSEAADADHSFLSRLEHGTRRPSRQMVGQLGAALAARGATVDDRARLYVAAGFAPDDATVPPWAAAPIVERFGRWLQAADEEEARRAAWVVGRMIGEGEPDAA